MTDRFLHEDATELDEFEAARDAADIEELFDDPDQEAFELVDETDELAEQGAE